jgi:hypothetical protein
MNDNTNITAAEQVRAQQTSQGSPIVLIPALTQNILTIVSFLIGTSSFILGLKMQCRHRHHLHRCIIDHQQIF